MTPIQTVLWFAGAPLAIIFSLAALVYGASARRAPRYRPGRPFAYRPVWFVAAEHAPALDGRAAPGEHAAVEARHTAGELTAGTRTAAPAAQGKGGARGNW
jgi:hypothetical protein